MDHLGPRATCNVDIYQTSSMNSEFSLFPVLLPEPSIHKCSSQWHLLMSNFFAGLLHQCLLPGEFSLGGTVLKNMPVNTGDVGDVGLVPGWGRSPGGGNGNPLQYSCLENPTGRGAWQAIVHRVTKSRIQLSD